MSEIEDRRQRAREAAYDAVSHAPEYYETRAGIDAAIETATQVKITEDVVQAALRPVTSYIYANEMLPALREAFIAAGFEVVE